MSKDQELQCLADDMASIAVDGFGYQWVFDKQKEEKFIRFISNYIKRAATKSELASFYKYGRWDPEDAYCDVLSSVWLAFRKYGPRPMGNNFIYLLKLKTNNILTNRVRKANSHKNKLNFISGSLEHFSSKEDTNDDYVNSHIVQDAQIFYSKRPLEPVYNRNVEDKTVSYIEAKDTVVGEVYLTRMDKLVQIEEICSDVAIVRIFATDKTLQVPLAYPLRPYKGAEEDPIEASLIEEIKVNSEEEDEQAVVEAVDTKECTEEKEHTEETLVFSASDLLGEEDANVDKQTVEEPILAKEEEKQEVVSNEVQPETKEEAKKETGMEGKSLKALVLEALHEVGGLTRQELADRVATIKGLPPEKLESLLTQISVQLTLLKKAGRIVNEKMKWRVVEE